LGQGAGAADWVGVVAVCTGPAVLGSIKIVRTGGAAGIDPLMTAAANTATVDVAAHSCGVTAAIQGICAGAVAVGVGLVAGGTGVAALD
jgi:hypothetical protein